MYNKETDGHVILWCKGHYERTIENLWEIKKKVYALSDDRKININMLASWMLDIIIDLNLVFNQNNKYRLREFFSNIAPENTWKVGYYTKQSRSVPTDDEYPEYDYYTAMFWSCVSTLNVCQVRNQDKDGNWYDIIELPKPDSNMAILNKE